MKRILGIIVIAILVIFIAIIGFNMINANKMVLSDIQEIENDENIDFKVTKVNNKSLTLRITNNLESDISYDMVYEIQKYLNGKWYKYIKEIYFIQTIQTISSKSFEDLDIIYSTIYSLDKGKYRIIKYVDSKIMSAEFEI